jgi:dolichyl-phosphate-mannose-protein mannosyltransferase
LTRWVWLIIGLGAGLRLALAASVGFGQDETYSVAVARQLALSYFDHPPLHLWIVGAWARLIGREDPWLLRLPFILLFAVSSALLYQLTAKAFGRRAGLWALIALNLAPMFTLSSASWVLPDGPLLCSALAMVCSALHALEPGRSPLSAWRWWLLAGLCAGLALLSKYLAVFPILGLLCYLLGSAHRRVLATPAPWFALMLATAVFSPVLLWNAMHGWVSFAFQGSRALPSAFSLSRGAAGLAAQCMYLLPWIALALAAAICGALSRRASESAERLFVLCAIGPIAFFAVAGFWTIVLPHWPAVGWLFAFPLLGRGLAQFESRHALTLRWGTMLSAGVLGVLLACATLQARTGWLDRYVAQFPQHDPTVELLDWRVLQTALRQRGLLTAGSVIATVSWIDAGRVDFALAGTVPVLCLSDDPRQYAFLRDARNFNGRNALLIANARRTDWQQRAEPYFQRIEPLPGLQLLRAGRPVITLALARGVTLSAPPAVPPGSESARPAQIDTGPR